MKKRTKPIIRLLALFLAVILIICNAGTENVAAFWNNDSSNFGSKRDLARIQVELMHCYHSSQSDPLYSKHFDSNGQHLLKAVEEDRTAWLADTKNNPKKTNAVKSFPIQPRINNDIAVGTATYDVNKYIYEYELSYTEASEVDYAVVTQPYITHFSKSEAAGKGVTETHNRMYWIGEYQGSIADLKDEWTEITNKYGQKEEVNIPDNDIGWWDFKHEAYAKVDASLSQQTWETVENMGNQDERTFIINPNIGEDAANGQRFLYLLEGTFLNKDIGDANHPRMQDTGVPAYYGGHIYGIIGLVFYRTITFDANGGTLAYGSISDMQVYNGSSKSKVYPWFNDVSKESFYSDIDITNPYVSTQYGNVSVKKPSRYGYSFLGWYAPELNTDGSFKRDENGDIICSDVPIYDANGKAVLTYTDSNGVTQSSPYFDSDGNWIYRGNVTAAAKWEYTGIYSLHYDKGESNNPNAVLPDDGYASLKDSIKVADGNDIQYNVSGSDYSVGFEVYTNNGGQAAEVVHPINGRFPFGYWNIEGKKYNGVKKADDIETEFNKPDAIRDEAVKATAVYQNYSFTLPSTSCKNGGYRFVGWYKSYDPDTQTFGDYAGTAGDTFTIPTSGDSVKMTLYAKWEKADIKLSFDYNLPSTPLNSRLGYVITGNEVNTKIVQHGNQLGALPAPTLTGYRLNTNTSEISPSDGWSTKPNRADGTQVNVPVYSGTLYDSSCDTLYAQWEPVYYTIKYNLDGGSVSHENPKEYINYYKEITIYSPARDGSTFLGWDITGMDGNRHLIDGKLTNTGLTSYRGAGVTKASDGTVIPKNSIKVTGLRADDGTVTLTALWKDTEYSITYDYRDAESKARLTPDYDPGNPVAYTRNTPTFTLKNPQVKGYYTGPLWGGTGITGTIPSVTIEQGSTGDRSYTAYFSPFEYEILYDLSGGSWGADASHPDRAKYNRTFNVSTPILDGCVFEGWEITGMCDDCSHNVGGSTLSGATASGITGTTFMNLRCDSSDKVRFTARWSHVSYDIKYELNGGSYYSGGSYPASAQTYTSFDINNPVRSGYTFAGWTISGMDGGLHCLPSGNTYAESASSVGTGKTDGMALTYDNLRYSSGTVTFKAAWVQDTRQVAFFGNGGSMTGDSVKDDWTLRFTKFGSTAFFEKYGYDTIWGTDVPMVSKTGYTFKGYYDALTGGNPAYKSNDNDKLSKVTGLYWDGQGRWIGPSLILYAQFIPDNYSVTFNVNGGCWADNDKQDNRVLGVTYDSTKNNRAYGQSDVYRPGYTFLGWSTNPDGTGYAVYDIDGYNTGEGGYWSEGYRK